MTLPDVPGTPVTIADLDPQQPVPEGFVLLDVREQDEWDAGHAPGAVHIPMGELPARVDELPDGELLVVCRSGGRSARSAAWLNHSGYDAYNVEGGMKQWQAAGLPLTAEDGRTATVL
ncbi:rhodanese-like domain-containing protein [Georgenia thermotolerans]|uniref:Rhodanese-like domain-containing protein n=1 Tax=Georgenia thermotolerans TaxID=527326 RepID=A0A7J5USX8_9MICO|nr:rhodanese-like domain-containing protein [Georgenia thermotolerans]KAE8765516.1 rhodanese-like domain-containing protein [Georgenia thermotolerans]